MRKTSVLAGIAAAAALTFGAAGPAAAHSAHPCNDTGGPGHSDYATHHIVPLAQQGALGNDGHKPGSHRGYSLCIHG